MRRLMGLPTWCSTSSMFANLNVNSFQEVLQHFSYILVTRIEKSSKSIMPVMRFGDAYVKSSFRIKCCNCFSGT